MCDMKGIMDVCTLLCQSRRQEFFQAWQVHGPTPLPGAEGANRPYLPQ